MSQKNRKYKQLEALLSAAKLVQPDPETTPTNQDVDKLKAQVAELEGKLAERQSEPAEIKPVVNQENQTPLTSPKAVRSLKLSRKILLPVLAMFSLVFLGFSIFSYITSAADARAKEAEDSRLAEEFFQSKIQNITDFANGLAIQTATNPDIQAAFAARDRETLQNLTSGTFQALEAQYQVRQFQFHLSPATSFLRLHSTKFGDDLSTFRFTVLEVNATQRPIAGLEVGRGGAGIRGVQPVFYKGRHIGSVEFGLNFDKALATSLKEEFGNDWRILLTRDALSLATLEDLSLLEDGPTPDTLVLASTIEVDYPDASTYAKVLNGERLITSVNSGNRNYSVTSLPLRDYSGKIIGVVEILIDRTTIIQTQNNRITLIVSGMIVALVVGAYILTTITNRSLQPLGELTRVAKAMEIGDLNQQIKIFSRDEIGQLGNAFNQMSSQLRNLFGSLEQRVLDRTHDLELASEVGRTITEKVANANEMLTEAAEMIRTRFDLYYTQVYLADPAGRALVLRAGTGAVGDELLKRGHRLPIDSGSLNGQAVLQKKPIIVADTLKSASFKPNPLLPNTRSEMAVPLIVGGHAIGVLDMQSEHPGTLNETNLPAFEALAGQLAVALQNASLFAQAEAARVEVETQMHNLTEHGWMEFMNAIDRGQRVGYAYDQSQVVPLKDAALAPIPAEQAISIPIQVTGAKVGMIQLVNQNNRDLSMDEKELLQATANQLAQHLDSLRLLAQAEGYRVEAEDAVRRLTREGWASLQTRSGLVPGYFFNLNEVKTLSENGNGKSKASIKQPLVVREEAIGELSVDGNHASDEAKEIVQAVARQLSGHIENLRLSQEIERRAYELATVANVSTAASTLLDPDQLLQSVVDLTKERFGLYHAHIYLADEAWQTLLLAAGAGEVGRQMVAEDWSIPINHQNSIVADAARSRESVIANNVYHDKDSSFLSNRLLPDTRSEMAVPMIVGDNLLGVFDVQSDVVERFTDEDVNIYTTLAAQVAIALQNARLYVEQAATVTQLRELDRLKSAFLANMSHELRTPLNSILGFSDVILEELDGPITEIMDNDLRLIQKNGKHLLHLINDVLDMAKIDAGRMNLHPEKFKLHELFDEVVGITSSLALEKSLPLNIKDDSDRDVEVYADRTRIQQVMINLVNNAIKFTEKGEITVHANQPQNGNVVISVRDTGLGIPSDHLETVFQEFTQVDTSTTRKVGGTGLGLPISRRLIQLHGGRLWAESTGVSGEGSVLYVELPLEAKMSEPVEKQEK